MADMFDCTQNDDDEPVEYSDGSLVLYCEGCNGYHVFTVMRKSEGGTYLLDQGGDCLPMFFQDLDGLRAVQDVNFTGYLQTVIKSGNDYLRQLFSNRRSIEETQLEAQARLDRYIAQRQRESSSD